MRSEQPIRILAVTGPVPKLDVDRARAASLRTRYREIRNALEDLQVTAESKDRSVRVDMGVGGRVLAVNLTDAAMDQAPQALAQLLVVTINAAMQLMAAQTNEAVRPLVSSASLDLQAITTGRLPAMAEDARSDYASEIERASAFPKPRLGSFASSGPVENTAHRADQEDGNG